MSNDIHDDDLLEVDSLSDHYPSHSYKNDIEIPSEENSREKLTPEEINEKQHREEEVDKKSVDEQTPAEEINVNPTPKYSSFEQIKKELVILDLERKIAWEELMSIKHEYKEDLSPSNFVEPALKTVGIIGGLVLLKNMIFGK